MVRSLPLERLATDSEGTRESELVLRARKGDGQAFSELVAPYVGLMYRIAARASRSAALAEDAVQETLEIVHRGLGRYEPGTSFKAFVAAIAVRRARTLFRAEVRRSRRELSAPVGEAPVTPAEWLAAEETANRIRTALAALPEKRRQVALLRLDAGLGYAEIAAAVGTTEGSARVLVHHALKELSDQLKDLVAGVRDEAKTSAKGAGT